MALADDLKTIGQKVRQVYLLYNKPLHIGVEVGNGPPKYSVTAGGMVLHTGNAESTIVQLDAVLGNPEGALKAVKRVRKQRLEQRQVEDQTEIDRIDSELLEP